MGNYFSCEEKTILRRFCFVLFLCVCDEYEKCFKLWSGKFRVTHSQFLGKTITAHLDSNAWLWQVVKISWKYSIISCHLITLHSVCLKTYRSYPCRHYMTLVSSQMDLVDYACLDLSVTSWHLACKCVYWYLGISTSNSHTRCMPMLHNGWLKCTQMTLGISMLENIFLLYSKM